MEENNTVISEVEGTKQPEETTTNIPAMEPTATPSTTPTPEAEFQDAASAVAAMKVGWNLGNTLDSCGSWLSGDNPITYECGWGNSVTTQALFAELKAAGFNAVRIPVTWYQHVEKTEM